MIPPFAKTVDDATLKEAEEEVATVLAHLKKLLRVKNRLYSPLLRLPTETIVRILSFIMEDMGSHSVWSPIFSTCCHIHRIMCNETGLWWKVDVSLGREAQVVLMRSKGNPRAVIAKFDPWDEWETSTRNSVLIHWRDEWVLQGDKLHTLEFFGTPYSLERLTWIFKQPLPRLERLKLHVVSALYDEDDFVSDPVLIHPPVNTPPSTHRYEHSISGTLHCPGRPAFSPD